MAGLVVTSGEQQGKYFKLAKRPLACGRDPAAEIQVVDPKVSRRHFLIRFQDGGYVVRELRSKNGVFVNDARIAGEQRLQDGDAIRVGDTGLMFCEHDDPNRTNALEQYRKGGRDLREDRTLGG